jgi:hypothetical protein
VGVFSQWQPRYAERRIATFPVGADKKPCIKNWNKIGLKASERLVEQFSSTNALGFPLGPRSRVTLLDLETKDTDLLEQGSATSAGARAGHVDCSAFGATRSSARPDSTASFSG